jgi:hypothetical protein
MTFRELRKWLDGVQGTSNNNTSEENKKQIQLQSERFAVFRDKPFWISDIKEHKKADIANKGACY